MSAARAFGVDDWRAAREDVRRVLQEVARHRDTVSYAEFGRMLSAPMHHRNPALYELLRDVCAEEHTLGKPNLCALVVRKSSGMPGKGFFEAAAFDGEDIQSPRDYWWAQVLACWEYYAEHEGDT